MPKIEPEFVLAPVQGGRLDLSNWQNEKISAWLKRAETLMVRLTLSLSTKFRSNDQNAYYWSEHVKRCCEFTGYTPKEQHEVLKWEFLPHMVIPHGEKQIEVAVSTTDLSTTEFTEFLTKIEAHFGTEHGITFQTPQEWYDSQCALPSSLKE